MAFTDNGKSILAKYGLYQPSEEEKKHQQNQAALRVRDAGTMATNAAIELARGLGARKAGVQIPSFQAFNPTTGKATQTDETGTALQEGTQAGVNPYAYQTPANMRGSQWTDDGRRILAKYGLADYTREEMAQRQTWANKLSGYSDEAQNAYTHLGDKGWLGYTADKANRDALDRQIAEIEAEMKRVGYYDVNYNDMGEYANYLRKLRSAYDARERGAGYAGSLEEYNAAQKLQDIQGHLGNTGWNDLGADSQYTRDLDLTLQAAQRELQQATGKRRDELQEYVDWLQQMKSAYDSRAEIMESAGTEQAYLRMMNESQALQNWGKGKSKDEVYQLSQQYVGTAQNAVDMARRDFDFYRALSDDLMKADLVPEGTKAWRGPRGEMLDRQEAEALVKKMLPQAQANLDKKEQELLTAKSMSATAGMQRYDDLITRKDYQSKVAAGNIKLRQMQSKAETERLAKEIEANAGNVETAGFNQVKEDWYTYRMPTDKWDGKQRDIYAYLLEEDEQKAYDYAFSLNNSIMLKERQENMAKYSDWAHDHPFWGRKAGTAARVLTSPLGFWDYMGSLVQYGNTGLVMPRAELSPRDYANALSGGAAQRLNERGTLPDWVPVVGGKGEGDLYQLGNSVLESLAWGGLSKGILKLGGPEALGAAVTNLGFFGNAASETTQQALERGATPEQALTLGFWSGFAEAAGETLSVEHLIHLDEGSFRTLWRNIRTQGLIEGSEEGFTTLLNTWFDAMVMGDKSELNKNIEDLMYSGMNREDATRQAWKQWANDIAFDVLGGILSGGLSASVGTNPVGNAYQALTQYKGDTQGLFEQARLADEGSDTRWMLDKYQKRFDKKGNISNLQARRLQEQTRRDLNQADKTRLWQDVRQRLESQMTGKLSPTELNEMATKIRDGILEERSSSEFKSGLERNVFLEARSQFMGGSTPTGSWLDTSGYKTAESRAVAERRLKSVELKSGERVEVTSAKMDGGKLVFTYKDGGDNTVSLDDMKLDSYQAEALQKLTDVLGEDAAHAYNGITEGSVRAGNYIRSAGYDNTISIAEYASAWGNVRDILGRTGVSLEYALKSNMRNGLTDAQVTQAWTVGHQRFEEAKAKEGTVEEGEKSKRGTGTINMNGVTIKTADGEIKLKGINNKAKAKASMKYKVLEAFAKAMGIDMVLYDSQDGKLSNYNGLYDDGVIYLDWSALQSGNKKSADWVMFRTLSHELTHFIEQNAKSEYAELRDFVTKYLAESKGLDFNKLVAEKMLREYDPKTGKLMTHERAMSEVVADACETMLRDSQYVRELMDTKPNLFERIRRFVLKFLGHIEASDEAAKELQPVLDEMHKLWDKGLRTAVESRTEAETSAAEMKAEVLENSSEALTDIDPTQEEATVTLPDGAQHSIRSMRHDIAEGKMFEDLERYTDMSRDEVRELRTNLERLTDIIALNRDILDLNESYGKDNRPFKPYKPNSDPLYTISLDFSTLCRKRLMTQYVIEKLQTELTDSQTGKRGRPLTAEEQLAVRDLMKEYGKQEKALKVACAMCYVEAARLKAPGQIQRFMRDPTEPMRRYFALRNKDFNASVREAQADFKEQRGYARDAKKADMKPADVKALNKLSDRLRSEYQLSAEEQAEMDIAKTLPNETYLTAANLARLAEEHPVIYDAYTATIRSATRSKSLEADIPYYYGDSRGPVSDDFISAVNSENGMRFSSWSDFQIQHMLDMMTAVIELSTRHCAMHGYTKFLEQVRIFGRTGMMFNMSGVANGTGLKADGSLDFSPTESVLVYGQDGEYDAIRARDEFPETAGLQCIGISAEHIQALLDSDIIDYIIPYHTSGLNATLRRMAQISNWDDFTAFQNAKQDPSIKFDPSIHDRETWHKEPVFSEFFNAAKQESNGYRAGEKGIVTMRRAADLYKQMCRERGMMPKFSWGNSKVNADFSNDPNYWKLLIDRKMINQKTGTLIEQKPVRPDFDFKLIEQMVQEAVDAYDPTLQDRALNYVREHLDELPQRIADLKKAGAVKKVTGRKTNKAAKTLQAGPVAAVSEGNVTQNAAQMSARDNPYTYEKLTEKKPMAVAEFQAQPVPVVQKKNGQLGVDAGAITTASLKDADTLHNPPAGDMHYVYIEDIGQNVKINRDAFGHSTTGNIKNGSTMRAAEVSFVIPEVLRNSIAVNELSPRTKADGTVTYVLFGVALRSDGNAYLVRSTVNHFADNRSILESVEIYNVLKGFKAKMIDAGDLRSRAVQTAASRSTTKASININVSDLLDYVKDQYPEYLPDSVLQHYGMTVNKVPGLQFSTRGNVGYHAGDLGKAEFLKQQGRYRGTGHFGTGTYFVGVEEKVTKDSHYGKRPQHAVDFSDYNLYKVRNDRDGYKLHDALKIIDGGIKREWINPAMDEQFNIINPTGYYDLARSKYGEEWARGDNLVNAMREYAADNGIKVKTLDEYKADEGKGIDDSDVMYYYEDYVKETVKEEIGKVNEQYHEFRDAIFDMNLLFGFKRGKIASALKAVADYQDVTPRDARADSYATVFMKNMGYDGVNVNGTGLDNTAYGSVIYDVKPSTVLYSVRSDNKTDRELLANAYQDMLRNEQLHAKAQTELAATKQRVINRMQQEQKEALEAHHKQLEDFKKKEKEVFTELAKLDRLVQEGTDPDAIREQRAKATAAEERMNTAMKKLAQMQERPALQKILQDERQIQRERTRRQLRENINKRELRKKVDRLWKDLNRRITSPTEKKNIPVEVMQQAIEVLQALNMDTSREGSKAGEKLRAKLDALSARYRELQNDPDYRKAAMYDAQVAEFLQKMTEAVGDTPINKMSYEQLETVFNTLQALDFTARRALKLKLGEEERNAYEVSMDMTRETRSVTKPKTGLVSAWLNAQLSAERMFRRLGNYHKNSVWEQVYRILDDGQLKQTRLMMEGSLIFEDLLAAKDYEKFVDPKNTVDLGLQDANGNAVRLTHGMMVSLWMHLQNEQNRRHVAYGGLTIPGLADYYKGNKTKGSERAVRVGGVLQEMAEINDRLRETEDADEIAELEAQRDALAIKAFDFLQSLESAIEKNLSAYDRQWIEACKEMFDGFSKRVLNETTMEVYGIKRANVENYFPIWVDGDFLNTPFETVAKDMSLENAGFMKERVDSSKPIRLADVSDVAASQIRKVSQYAGLMPVVRDFNKIWGKTQTGYRDSLRKAVHETFGQNGVKYIENLMADLNGARGLYKGSLGEFFDRMRGHMAQAALTLSLRTAMGQMASYPTAASVVGWKALHKAFWKGGRSRRLISRADKELIRKWSPLLYYRMKGYRDTELGNIAGMNSKFDRIWKKARWVTGWIQAIDGATVGRLWYAAEYYVQDHHKDLAQGSDAYYEEVAKVFNDIVEKTQPNYSVMQRPDILRNPNALVKQLTMFLTQRLQNFNILYDAFATYSTMKADYKAGRNGVTREDVRQAAVETRTAVLSQVAAAATIVAFKFVADMILHSMNAYRDDDDEELTAESVSMELLDMFLDSLAGNVLGGSEVYDLIESKVFGKSYYGISLSGVETVTDLIDAVSKVYDHAANGKYKDKDAIISDLDLLAKRLGPVAGIPYANAKKIILGGWYWIQDIKNGEFLHFEAGVDRTSAQQAARAVSAYEQADSLKIDKILAEVGVDKEKTLRENMRKQIKQQYQNGEISFYEAEKRLKEYGEASDQMMRNFINAEYEAGHITRTEAAAELAKYGGMTAEAAEKSMIKAAAKQDTGLSYNEIDDMFQLGNLTAAEARDALVKYGLSREDASLKVEYWDYQNKHPGSFYTSEERYRTYVNNYKPLGFTAEMYESFKTRWDEVPGEDKNHDGKADPNTKKYQRIEIIDSLPLSSAQKDALFNMEWKTGLEKAPWHK